jgi:VWFA-related protein
MCNSRLAQRIPIAAILLLATGLLSQDVPTISVNVKVVNVLATVRDKKGKVINTLSQNDFSLDEDGRPQTIKYFTRETDIPLTLGLLVDTSISQVSVLGEERSASGTFVNQVLRADKDSAFLIHFDRDVELLQDVTKSPQQIDAALDKLDTPTYETSTGAPGGGGYPGGGGHSGGRGGHHGGGTLLYDSVFLAADELMSKQQGRKAVVILSDGVDHGSKTSIDRAIESAQRADTIVYTIWFTGTEGGGGGWERHGGGGGGGGRRGGWGSGWPGGGGGWPGGGGGYPRAGGGSRGGDEPRMSSGDGKKILERISKETGGRMFEVSKKQSVSEIYQQIQDELRNQYNIGYTPDKTEGAEYRKIHLAVKEKDLTVQARDGYYASKQVPSAEKQGQ